MANSKKQIELASKSDPPDPPPGTKFESYIGKNVTNLSNVQFSEHKISTLEKGLTFCPTPGPLDKSKI